MTLLSLASKQIWPQVLAVAHLKPERLFLLHSEDEAESRGPAQRLKRFFDETALVPRGSTRLESLSDSDFEAIGRCLDEIQTRHALPLGDCALSFTGGNKLMATAAFRWAAKRGIRSFYLERRNRLTWFDPREGEVITRSEPLDGHRTDELDAVALLRCQTEASEVERPGQRLTLNPQGKRTDLDELTRLHADGSDLRRFLQVEGQADLQAKQGDALEFNTATVALKLGVGVVHRSLRLKVKSGERLGTRKPHAELDLLFNFDGRLWLVDCKDRRPEEDLVHALKQELRGTVLSQAARDLFERIGSEMSISQTKALKHDLVAIREAGGLLGQVVCVRKVPPPEEVLQYAMRNQIRVISRADLVPRLGALLRPTLPATPVEP